MKATLHWVSASGAVDAEVRMIDHLFTAEHPEAVPEGVDWKSGINPKSLETLTGCKLEPSLASAKPGESFQFERMGYFCCDPDTTPGKPVFNRTVTLKDAWAKIEKAGKKGG